MYLLFNGTLELAFYQYFAWFLLDVSRLVSFVLSNVKFSFYHAFSIIIQHQKIPNHLHNPYFHKGILQSPRYCPILRILPQGASFPWLMVNTENAPEQNQI